MSKIGKLKVYEKYPSILHDPQLNKLLKSQISDELCQEIVLFKNNKVISSREPQKSFDFASYRQVLAKRGKRQGVSAEKSRDLQVTSAQTEDFMREGRQSPSPMRKAIILPELARLARKQYKPVEISKYVRGGIGKPGQLNMKLSSLTPPCTNYPEKSESQSTFNPDLTGLTINAPDISNRLLQHSQKVQKPIIKQKPERPKPVITQVFNDRLNIVHTIPANKQKDLLYLLQPVYTTGTATIYFTPILSQAKTSHPYSRLSEYLLSDPDCRLNYKIGKQSIRYQCIIDTLENSGFQYSDNGEYNIMISGVPSQKELRSVQVYQKINHFPGSIHLGHKDLLWRSLHTFIRKFPQAYDFCPYTYIMPEDYQRFKAKFHQSSDKIWIKKPTASSQGRGVSLVSNPKELHGKQRYLVSEYIQNPHLIGGFKYDLRIYVCVTSFDPLCIYIYNEGLVRFATQQYTTSKKKRNRQFVHLTNYSVNKHSRSFEQPQEDGKGSK